MRGYILDSISGIIYNPLLIVVDVVDPLDVLVGLNPDEDGSKSGSNLVLGIWMEKTDFIT